MRKLLINDDIELRIKQIQAEHSFKREIGGILVGLYDADHESLRVTDISFPYSYDQRCQFRFLRKSNGHQELMDQLWEDSEHTKAYLGEWHTHNQDNPVPSMIDRNTWKRIAKRNNNFDDSYFMIIGKKAFVVWTVSNGNIVEIYRGENDGK